MKGIKSAPGEARKTDGKRLDAPGAALTGDIQPDDKKLEGIAYLREAVRQFKKMIN